MLLDLYLIGFYNFLFNVSDFNISLFDALSGSSSVKITYQESDGRYNDTYISCNFYPVVVFASSKESYYTCGLCTRNSTVLGIIYGAGTGSSVNEYDVSWGDDYVQIESNNNINYYCVIGY